MYYSDNPPNYAINQLIDELEYEVKTICKTNDFEIKKEWSLYDLARYSTLYIQHLIWHLVDIHSKNGNAHQCIIEFCKRDYSQKHIFTLNYDTLLEQSLMNSK